MTAAVPPAPARPADRAARTFLFIGADAPYSFATRSPLMRALIAGGDRVVAVDAPRSDADAPAFAAIGAEFIAWDRESPRRRGLHGLRRLAHLHAIIGRVRPDVLFAHTIEPVILGTLAARLCGVPHRAVMIPGAGYAFMPTEGLRHALVKLVAHLGYRLALRNATVTIFQNHDDLDEFRRLQLLGRRARVGIVDGSGVDLARFAPRTFVPGPPAFLMVARLRRDKGVCEFVEAARRLKRERPAARFVLLGAADDSPAAVAQSQIERWRAEGVVEAPGQAADPRPAYAACHAFVLPSYREGLPRSAVEAMAVGRAVIATDVPGCRETVRHGHNGLLVPPRDVDALVAAMRDLADDQELARQMGLRGREICRERFEVGLVSRQTVALIDPQADLPAARADLRHLAPTSSRLRYGR